MSPATTIAAYAVALAAVFGAGLALGGVVGPVGTAGEPARSTVDIEHTEMDMTR